MFTRCADVLELYQEWRSIGLKTWFQKPDDDLVDPCPNSRSALAFSTAGPIHALLLVFKVQTWELGRRWVTAHAVSAGSSTTGGFVGSTGGRWAP
jgi:hypothetical protein